MHNSLRPHPLISCDKNGRGTRGRNTNSTQSTIGDSERPLSDKLFVPVILRATVKLLYQHNNHRLFAFMAIGTGKSRRWVIFPQRAVVATPHGWSAEDKRTIDEWLAQEDRFHAFMLPNQLKQFKGPVVDILDGKLVIRSGKKKITPLE